MTIKKGVAGIVSAIVLIIVLISFQGMIGSNNDQDWQVKQSLGGEVEIIDRPGYYLKGFSTIWTYPRATQKYFSASEEEGSVKDESIEVTFNDGGQAKVSTMLRYQLPTTEEHRRKMHRDFSGNSENVIHSIRSHLINCLKATAPLMTATENQSSRKAEFTNLVHKQMEEGLYEMRKVEKLLKDQTDENGDPITVYGTEIVWNMDGDGNRIGPKISQPSPLKEYGIAILQFSITGTEYDKQTRDQFATKKTSFLKAEQMKAEREQEVQQRLMVEEKGKREKAEITAKANVEKAEAVIKAEKEKEMAEISAQQKVAVETQAKLEAEVKIAKELSIKETEKKIAETVAQQELAVAKLKREAATENAESILILAKAEQEKIKVAGAITEKERVLAEIAAKRDVSIAEAMTQIKVPSIIIGGNDKGGNDVTSNLINLKLLEATGILDKKKEVVQPVLPVPVVTTEPDVLETDK